MTGSTECRLLFGSDALARVGAARAIAGLLASLLLAASAHAEYTRPAPKDNTAPTAADLMLYEGASKSLTVQVLNLTPYDIEFTPEDGKSWSITAADETSMADKSNRFDWKSFMFAPAGVPTRIPAAPSQDFETPTIKVKGETVPNPNYDPTWVDTVTHPYPMLFAWNDHDAFKQDNWVKWTVRDVGYWSCDDSNPNDNCEYLIQDVGLGLWMYRNQPKGVLQSGYLTEVVAAVKTVFQLVKIVVDPLNPVAWMNEFLALERLGDETREFLEENKQENDGDKMWVASYVIPHPQSACGVTTSLTCTPTLMKPDDSGDGIYVNWSPSAAGPMVNGTAPDDAAEALLTVSVHIYRGHKAKQCDPTYYPNKCPLGMDPIVMITVMRATDFTIPQLIRDDSVPSSNGVAGDKSRRFLAQAGAVRIRQLIRNKGTYGLDVLRGVLSQLQPTDQRVLLGMIRDMHSGRLPTAQERKLVQRIATELQAQIK